MHPIFAHVARFSLLGLLGAVALVGAAPAAADTPLIEGGQRGQHLLQDTNAANRGAECLRQGGVLMAIQARPPVMYAIDRTPMVDKQSVAWQARIIDRATGAVVRVGPIQGGLAFDNAPAAFAPVVIHGPWAPHEYIVQIRMHWYQPGSNALEGVSLHQVDFYGQVVNGALVGAAGSCRNPL